MLQLLQKIMATGIVTESYDHTPPPQRFRGAILPAPACPADCSHCIDACPADALYTDNGSLSVRQQRCAFCGRCVAACDHNRLRHSSEYELASLANSLAADAGKLRRYIRSILGRSLAVRHVDIGSCNGCDFEMAAMTDAIYDLQQYGIDIVASPRHADLLMVTGVVTRNSLQALQMTYEATPAPRLVMAVGACAAGGTLFGPTYATLGPVHSIVPVDIFVPGCPPRPQALLYGLLLALGRL